MHPDLRAFLEANLPAASPEMSEKKKKKAILGVFDSRLSTSINAELGLNCMHTGVVAEILRGQCCTSIQFIIFNLHQNFLK